MKASSTHDFSASYGSLARFKDIKRLYPVGNNTVIGAGGDISDFQYIQKMLDELMIDEITQQDGHTLGPAEIHEYLSQVMYARRTKMNPLCRIASLELMDFQIPSVCRSPRDNIQGDNDCNWIWCIYRAAAASESSRALCRCPNGRASTKDIGRLHACAVLSRCKELEQGMYFSNIDFIATSRPSALVPNRHHYSGRDQDFGITPT